MPYLISTSFDRFLEKLTPTGNQADIARTRCERIGELLGSRLEILELFPTGSLVRDTALKGVSDADVMAVLHYGKHVEGKSPAAALEMVRDVLSSYNARIVKKNGQAVTLYFESWPNVDIVPAARLQALDDAFEIPDMTNDRWIRTQPRAHDRAMRSLGSRQRQLVRLIKAWNRAHSGYFQSFHIEKIAIETYIGGFDEWKETDWPWALVAFFRKALKMTESSTEISHDYNVDDWIELRQRLRRAEDRADRAWGAVLTRNDARSAVETYRVMFGTDFPPYG